MSTLNLYKQNLKWVKSQTHHYATLYLREMVKLHGVPLSIISNLSTQLTSKFWNQKGLVISLILSQLLISKSMGKKSVLFKLWKICWGIVRLILRVIWMTIFYWLNLYTIIVSYPESNPRSNRCRTPRSGLRQALSIPHSIS